MSKLKRFLVAFLSLVMLFALTGCGNGVDVLSFRDTLAAVNSLKSFMCKIDAQLEYSAYDIPGELRVCADGDIIIEPLAMSGSSYLDLGELGGLSFPMYIQTKDGERTLYFGMDLGGDIRWRSVNLGAAADNITPDIKTLLTVYLCLADTVTCAGEDKLGTSSATRYDFTVTRDDLATLISQLKLEEAIRQADSDFNVAAMAKALDDVSGSFWIAEDSKLPLRMEIELNTFAQSLVDSTLSGTGGTADIEVESLLVNIYFDNFDGVRSVKVPEEVKEAAK